ncbi:MAG: hypothetical protein WCT06_06985 [Armatimonadota bacterium]|jgi:hypothetical protein|nr:hypothetical protein [Armatimonadota bacterium]
MANESGLIFAKGVLYMDPDGDNIELGEIQDISFEVRDTVKEAKGRGLFSLAVELAERAVSVRASWLRVKAQGLAKLTGGEITYADDKTTISVGKDSMPATFKMKLSTPSDGSDIEIILHKVRPANFTLPLQLKEFTKPNAEFNVMVDEATDKVFDIILPGYQSVS